ncbi:MAG TPA: mechanosensitive ion channel domain-containing protein [Thermoplasmata archaeon]|nr:mechanosensitive ion channel domain-containing protein [Thermoplasmata archaeon]
MTSLGAQTILPATLLILLPAVVGILLTKWVGDEAKRRSWSPPSVRGIRILVSIGWISVATAGVFVTIGPIGFLSTLTVSAVAGIGATLALQTTLQNIVAGFLLIRRHFLRIGDQVELSGVAGRVVSIGLVTTVLRTADGGLAFASNSNMLAGPLINQTAGKRLAGEY